MSDETNTSFREASIEDLKRSEHRATKANGFLLSAQRDIMVWLRLVFEMDKVTEEIAGSFLNVVLDNLYLFTKKQLDYGPRNIASAGELGVLVRMNDKMARLFNLRGKDAANESKDDTVQDLAVYAPILQLLRKGEWPGVVPGWTL